MTELSRFKVVALGDVIVSCSTGYWGESEESAAAPYEVAVVRNGDLTREGRIVSTAKRFYSERDYERSKLQSGDVLLTASGEVGKVSLIDGSNPRLRPSNFLRVLRADLGLVDPAFLFFAFFWEPLRTVLRAHSQGSTLKNLKVGFFKDACLPLPPIAEQRAIARVLRTVQQAREETENCAHAAASARASLIETEIQRTRRLPLTPLVSALASKPQYGFTTSAASVGDCRFLRITDIQTDGVNWQTVPFCSPTPAEYARFSVESGDIVVARIGATTGKSFLVRSVPRAVFASYLIRLRTDRSKLLPEYLEAFMNSGDYWRQVDLEKESRLKNGVNATTLSQIQLRVPPPRDQEQFIESLRAFDAKVTAERRRGHALSTLFDSLLHELMAGRLRAPSIDLEVV